MKEKKEIKKRPPRTMKEKKFVKEYLENGGNKVQAALKVYDTTNYKSASRIGHENTEKLSMDFYFREAGLTEEVMAQNTTRIALSAKKLWGTGDDFIEVDDNPTQLKAMQFASELMGLKQVEGSGNTIVVTPIIALESE